MAKKRLGILISGRGSNMLSLIKATRNGKLDAEVALVLSDVADAPGLQKAQELGVEARAIVPQRFRTKLTGDDAQRYVDAFKEAGVELLCLAGFMRVVKDPLLSAFPDRILNIHPSLLPSFPGLDAQKQALDAGVPVSGCTVHFVDSTLDGGEVIKRRQASILKGDTVDKLADRILQEEHLLYPEAAGLVLSGIH